MAGVEAYRINIVGLSNKVHHFDYEIGNDFFNRYGTDFISEGTFHVDVTLDKHETFIGAEFKISGKAILVCDRSLDTFEYPIASTNTLVFKFGEETKEISDDIVIISRETVSLELGQYIYEYIGLAIPMKKLHPRYQQEDEDGDGRIVYKSDTVENKDSQNDIDPRWEKLKKLK